MTKKLLLRLIVIGLVAMVVAYYMVAIRAVVPKDWAPNTIVEIPKGSSYETIIDTLLAKGIPINRSFFDPLASRMNYRKEKMRTGRYTLEPGMTYVDLIRRLRTNQQLSVNVILTTEREPANVAAKAARFLEPDSLAFVRLFQNKAFLDSIGYTKETLQTLFIPNTYELYWESSPRDFVARMVKEHDRFWKPNNRRTKAIMQGITPAEV
ncbi:MAG: endolytic transglycosylase MltG, partial [Bacteroidota bacterium]